MSIAPFTRHTGVAAPLLQANIDTDAIIPSREMKRVSKRGLGEGLFAAWRYALPGGRDPVPDFVLNRPEYLQASILLSGPNFGCGSSREHAVWALKEFGIRAIIAPGFGAIFYNNCIGNGLLPVLLPESVVHTLNESTSADPQHRRLTIDLENRKVIEPGGAAHAFDIDETARRMLLEGKDRIAVTMQEAGRIDAFEESDRQRRPWVYL